MIFGRKKPAPPTQCPHVPDPLSRHEVQGILATPNGRNVLREMRTSQMEMRKQFADAIGGAEQHLRFCKGMRDNCDTAIKEINRALGEVQA
ncbi:hypothetical protein E2F46_10965 [Luteimonas aestuarii]|uniref:Uncharacterized protein n=1 Tax=Luteimonas aestuarii TaxID=453837 RepID=A0A4R5TRC4_9GAMM|nr:hypothetical protein [Luteimonas aestuarii]TDK23432.1 hypothetical protein E2F46_10965 [Luteimonas aestuarii]